MMYDFPKLYEDELFISGLARFSINIGLHTNSTFMKYLYDTNQHPFNKKKESKKKPKTNVIKLKDWNTLPSDDLRYIYSESKGKDIYNAFKHKVIILDFEKLIKEEKS